MDGSCSSSWQQPQWEGGLPAPGGQRALSLGLAGWEFLGNKEPPRICERQGGDLPSPAGAPESFLLLLPSACELQGRHPGFSSRDPLQHLLTATGWGVLRV